mmetsp:Transcript_40908/g.113737  ORF Transcript_40908/g.113737 Transcript_40908/m.113737 type:complete len:224 (-) Transcript_40908:138-809(-)
MPVGVSRGLPEEQAPAYLGNDFEVRLPKVTPPLEVWIVAQVEPGATTAKSRIQVYVGRQHAHLRTDGSLKRAVTMAHEPVSRIVLSQPPTLVDATRLPSATGFRVVAPPVSVAGKAGRSQSDAGRHQRPQATPNDIRKTRVPHGESQIPTVGLDKVGWPKSMVFRSGYQRSALSGRKQSIHQPNLLAMNSPCHQVTWRCPQRAGPIGADRDLLWQINRAILPR